jgi:glycosyltransferase involved in cell wall biosynthesis
MTWHVEPTLRVAFAHYSQENDISGVTTWVMNLARRLRGDGVDVAIHFVGPPELQASEPPVFEELRRQGIAVFSTPRRSRIQADIADTLAFLNQWQPTVFLPQCKPAHYAAAALAGPLGLPWVLTLHSDDPDYWATVRHFGGSLHAASIVSVSHHIQGELRRRATDRASSVIPYGVTLPERSAVFADDPFRVVFCGRIWEHQKRASLVIQALIGACRSHQSIRATLIGDGYARGACEHQVAEAGLGEVISFTGPLSSAEVQGRLAESQAILLMSDFEGLPIALLEAMAAGVVPVVRRIPSGIPELVTHERTGLLVSEDPAEAARAIVRLAGDPALWRRCSTAARTLVTEKYSGDASYAQWRRLLEDLDGQFGVAATSPYPIDPRRIRSLGRIDARLTQEYRTTPPLRERFAQALRTAVARAKHRIRGALGR